MSTLSPETTFSVAPPPDDGADREALIAWAKGEITRVREWVTASQAFGRGLELVHTHSDVIDAALRRLFAWVEEQRGEPCEGLAVLAQGGYGRRHMCLHSDVDLLILVDDAKRTRAEPCVREFVQALWDLGRDIGHSVRSVKEALAVVGEDFASTTALFEARFVVGHSDLAKELEAGIRNRLKRGVLSEYLRTKVEEMRGRHARFGDTVYLLEPNVKEGAGGLRDIHLCQWIGYACLGSPELGALAEAEVISEEDLAQLRQARDFLLLVRNALHAAAGRRADTLDFARQRAVAEMLDIEPTPEHQLAEEHLLHMFHCHARTIERVAERVARILPRRSSMASRLRRRLQEKRLRGGWVARREEITTGPGMPADAFEREPGQMLEICAVARERGLRLADEVREAIERALPKCDEAIRSDPANTERFLRILRGPAHTAETLRAMADVGLLGAYLPEWRRIQSMVRIDSYHRFTVDEHTLKCMEAAEALITGHLDEDEGGLSEAAHRIERWDLLMFGILLHDIGKGEGRGHVVKGGQIAQRIAQRIGLDEDESEILRQLVLGHLLIPHLAFRRDVSDPAVIQGLAQQCGSVEILDMLFVLTFADISGVHPENWTAWKGQLIWSLYQQARRVLEGEGVLPEEESPDPAILAERVLEHMGEEDSPAVKQRARELALSASERYRRSVRPRRMAEHARLLVRLDEETRAVWSAAHPERSNFSEITVAAHDEPGVFSLMCGALASKQINILSAQGYSTEDGFAVETFQVTDSRGGALPRGFVLGRIERLTNEVLRGEQAEDDVFPVRLGPVLESPEVIALAPTHVRFDNEISARSTVLEVRTVDRTGLLHALAHHLTAEGFMIYLAMISTESYRVVDVFYLTDLDGLKIDDPKRLNRVTEELQAVLSATK